MSGTALIDADILLHTFTNAATRSFEWGTTGRNTGAEDKQTVVMDERAARQRVDSLIKGIKRATDCGRSLLVLSDLRENWRKDLMPTYKLSRKAKKKSAGFLRLREYMEETYACALEPRLEADDVLGLYMTSPATLPGRKVCCSLDKDLLTIPGEHYQWKPTKAAGPRAVGKTFVVGEAEATHRFYVQVLMGDSVDGYPGIPKCGIKTAEKILDGITDEQALWDACVKAYEAKGLKEVDALDTARVARILRKGDYSRTEGVTLWCPPHARDLSIGFDLGGPVR